MRKLILMITVLLVVGCVDYEEPATLGPTVTEGQPDDQGAVDIQALPFSDGEATFTTGNADGVSTDAVLGQIGVSYDNAQALSLAPIEIDVSGMDAGPLADASTVTLTLGSIEGLPEAFTVGGDLQHHRAG